MVSTTSLCLQTNITTLHIHNSNNIVLIMDKEEAQKLITMRNERKRGP